MNKTEFISKVAEKTGFTKKDTSTTVDAVLETIKDSLVAGDGVKFTGFGSFEAVDKAERTARNPQTGAEIVVPEHLAPKAKFGTGIKNFLKEA